MVGDNKSSPRFARLCSTDFGYKPCTQTEAKWEFENYYAVFILWFWTFLDLISIRYPTRSRIGAAASRGRACSAIWSHLISKLILKLNNKVCLHWDQRIPTYLMALLFSCHITERLDTDEFIHLYCWRPYHGHYIFGYEVISVIAAGMCMDIWPFIFLVKII